MGSPPPVWTLYTKHAAPQHFVRVPYHEGSPDFVEHREGWLVSKAAVLASVEIPSGNLSGQRALGRTYRVVLAA